jgi:hypothetical protein
MRAKARRTRRSGPIAPSGLIGARGWAIASASRYPTDAQVAQLVEHATENRSVGGSNPPLGTIPSYAVPTDGDKINNLA